MRKQGAGYYFPGKDFDSLRTALKRAFGDVTEPDRNCYIEVEVKKDRDVAGQWLTEYEGKVENLHNYALNKTNYHLDRRGKHPIYSAQLTGIRNSRVRLRGELGTVWDFPHAFVIGKAFEECKTCTLLTGFTPDYYVTLKPDMKFRIKATFPVGGVEFDVVIKSYDGDKRITPDEVARSIDERFKEENLSLKGFSATKAWLQLYWHRVLQHSIV